MIGWTEADGQELRGIRIAISDIRDALMAKEAPESVGSCPHCGSPNTHDVGEFGTPAHHDERLCAACGCSWTVRRRVSGDAMPVGERGDAGSPRPALGSAFESGINRARQASENPPDGYTLCPDCRGAGVHFPCERCDGSALVPIGPPPTTERTTTP